MSRHLLATIFGEDDEPITVEGAHHPGMRGLRGPWGERETPDDADEMEFLHAFSEDGSEIELTDEQAATAVEALWEAL